MNSEAKLFPIESIARFFLPTSALTLSNHINPLAWKPLYEHLTGLNPGSYFIGESIATPETRAHIISALETTYDDLAVPRLCQKGSVTDPLLALWINYLKTQYGETFKITPLEKLPENS